MIIVPNDAVACHATFHLYNSCPPAGLVFSFFSFSFRPFFFFQIGFSVVNGKKGQKNGQGQIAEFVFECYAATPLAVTDGARAQPRGGGTTDGDNNNIRLPRFRDPVSNRVTSPRSGSVLFATS